MLRKKIAIAIIAGAGSLLLAGGMASAADESCFPSSSSECGVEWGTTPTTSYERAPVGATGIGAAGGETGPVEVLTPGYEFRPIDD